MNRTWKMVKTNEWANKLNESWILQNQQVGLHAAAAAAAAAESGHHPSTSAMYLTSQALGSLGFHRQALMETPTSSLHPYHHHHHHHHQHAQMQQVRHLFRGPTIRYQFSDFSRFLIFPFWQWNFYVCYQSYTYNGLYWWSLYNRNIISIDSIISAEKYIIPMIEFTIGRWIKWIFLFSLQAQQQQNSLSAYLPLHNARW